jgi:two-component system, OmpR family, sensor kinase
VTALRTQLLVWLLGALVLAGGAASVATYTRAQHDIDELLDYQLQQLAFSLSRQGAASPFEPGLRAHEPDFVTQIWDRNGVLQFYSRPNFALPRPPEPGFSNISWHDQQWRVFTQSEGLRTIQVAHPLSLRREMAADLARRAVQPLLALIPILAALIWIVVGRALRPLQALSRDVRARSASDLAALSFAELPDEVRPLVGSLNDLLQRLQRAIESQGQFVADAAHELRTPLTAVQLQLQVLQRAESQSERDAALQRLSEGIRRSTHLVQQLLTLARQEPGSQAPEKESVDLRVLAERVAADFELFARDKAIDLKLDLQTTVVPGETEGLRVMLNNLVENAIRYTPADGRVSVIVRRGDGESIVEVDDSGPGIPEDQRGRVFDRFYRATGRHSLGESGGDSEGTGLGLAIVKRVVDRHSGRIDLGVGSGGTGLSVIVRLPG